MEKVIGAMMKIKPHLRILDWGLAAGCLGYGLWKMSVLWIVLGVAGFALAWWNPAGRIEKGIANAIIRRSGG